jgi:hypothetical protein
VREQQFVIEQQLADGGRRQHGLELELEFELIGGACEHGNDQPGASHGRRDPE